jgi:hypothetical protein
MPPWVQPEAGTFPGYLPILQLLLVPLTGQFKPQWPFTNGKYGNPQALTGTASGSAESSKLQLMNQCHVALIDENTWVTGHQAVYDWIKFMIADWTGVSNNSWRVHAPNDPAYNFTNGNILQQ